MFDYLIVGAGLAGNVHQFGAPPSSSLAFVHETRDTPPYQAAPVLNYRNDEASTRIVGLTYLTGQQPRSSIVYAHPSAEGSRGYPAPLASPRHCNEVRR